jgi:hypothetical protein
MAAGHESHLYGVVVDCVISLRPFSPYGCSTTAGTSSSCVPSYLHLHPCQFIINDKSLNFHYDGVFEEITNK